MMVSDGAGSQKAKSLSVWGASLLGRRPEQEDAFRVEWLDGIDAWLLILCDGMGGHAAGALASQLADQAFRDAFVQSRGNASLRDAFRAALHAANDTIAERQKASPETKGMGTTLVGALVSEQRIDWISVGDSPLWLYRKGKLRRLNEDHSLRGLDGANAVSRNLLQSALTGVEIPLVDQPENGLALRPGDAVLLASDGLHTLEDEEIADVLGQAAHAGPMEATKTLLDSVSGRDLANQDNCTVIVLSRDGADDGLMPRIRAMLFGSRGSH